MLILPSVQHANGVGIVYAIATPLLEVKKARSRSGRGDFKEAAHHVSIRDAAYVGNMTHVSKYVERCRETLFLGLPVKGGWRSLYGSRNDNRFVERLRKVQSD